MGRIVQLIGVALCLTIAAGIPQPSVAAAAAPTKVSVGLNSDVRSFDLMNTMDNTTDRVITKRYRTPFRS